jgi:hypothetical protein
MRFDTLLGTDPVTTDPVVFDAEYPAEHFVTHFISAGTVVHASIWVAQGKEPKGTVIISPEGMGGDRLFSLIIPLMNAGLNVFTYQPRGMWDGVIKYTMLSSIDDVHAAVKFLETSDEIGKRTPGGRGYRVDPCKIGVLGLSGGGGTASFVACAENDAIDFAIAIGPANHELHRDLSIIDQGKELFDFVVAETAGRMDVEKRALGMKSEELDRLSIITQAPNLVNEKLLLIGAAHDTITPIESCHEPIVKALREAGATRLTDVILDSDHNFLNARIALARLVISWLRSEGVTR